MTTFCRGCHRWLSPDRAVWVSEKPFHPDCAINRAVAEFELGLYREDDNSPPGTQPQGEIEMKAKREPKPVPEPMSCAHCGKHIWRATQIMWQGGNYHPDCIGAAIAASKQEAAPEPITTHLDDLGYAEYLDEVEDEYDPEFGDDDEYDEYDEDDEEGDGWTVDRIVPLDAEIPVGSRQENTNAAPRTAVVQVVANSRPQVYQPPQPMPVAEVTPPTNGGKVGSLMSAKSRKVTREELVGLITPEATPTFQPIAHHHLVEQILESLWYRRMNVVREEYAVSHDGMKLYGLIEVDIEYKGVRFAIGLRNANDRSMRVAMVAGYRVICCDNGMLSGDFKPLLAKHSAKFELQDALAIACDRIQRNVGGIHTQIARRQQYPLSDGRARELMYHAFTDGGFPVSLLRTTYNEYFVKPSHPEFESRTVWSFENAFTTAFKKLQPVSQFEQTTRLARFLQTHLHN